MQHNSDMRYPSLIPLCTKKHFVTVCTCGGTWCSTSSCGDFPTPRISTTTAILTIVSLENTLHIFHVRVHPRIQFTVGDCMDDVRFFSFERSTRSTRRNARRRMKGSANVPVLTNRCTTYQCVRTGVLHQVHRSHKGSVVQADIQ